MPFMCYAGPLPTVRSRTYKSKEETSPLLPRNPSSDNISDTEPLTAPLESSSDLFSPAAPLLLSQADPSCYRQSRSMEPLNDQSSSQKNKRVQNTWSIARPTPSSTDILKQTQARLEELRCQYEGESKKYTERQNTSTKSEAAIDSKFHTDRTRVKRQAVGIAVGMTAAVIIACATLGLGLIPLVIGAAVSIGAAKFYAHYRNNKIKDNYRTQKAQNQRQIWDASRRATLHQACAHVIFRLLTNAIEFPPVSRSADKTQQAEDLLKYCFEHAGSYREDGFISIIKPNISIINQALAEIDPTTRAEYETILDGALLTIQGILLEKYAKWAAAQKRERAGALHPSQEALLIPSA